MLYTYMEGLTEAPRALSSTHCPFCTANTLLVAQGQPEADVSDPFAFHHLLAAGTITVAVHDGQAPCNNIHGIDAWHALPIRGPSNRPEDSLFRGLAFLTDNLFLRTTCRLGASAQILFIRVYLIPHDHPNVQGRLHSRRKTVVKEARRHLQALLPLIEQSEASWNADLSSLSVMPKFFLPRETDNRTMAEIYSDLHSPTINITSHNRIPIVHDIINGRAIWGLKSKLYGYQRQSVAVMIEKEMNSRPVPDPLYVAVTSISGEKYYLQPSTTNLLRECPMVTPTRGGILCEELGTGKTIMALSLVLATIGQLPEPEDSLVDTRPVLTPLAYRHFPSADFTAARARAGIVLDTATSDRRVPSLVELLLHHVRVARNVMDPREYENELEASHLWPLMQNNTPFYHHYNAKFATQMLRTSRSQRAPELGPRVMYLTPATLVIVPLTLLGQWDREILKHCHSNVRRLIVRPSTKLPSASALASDYDLIIMSDSRFRKESTRNKTVHLHLLKPCSCPFFEGSRVTECRCPGDPKVTPLLQIRWKRLVIDEGHISGNIAATVNHFVRELSIERKWIVTGTPTSNLLGLSLGRANEEQEEDVLEDVDSQSESEVSLPPAVSLAADSSILLPNSDGETNRVRIWGRYDSYNLRKLGTMIGDFLAVPQFHAEPKAFGYHVSAPLCDRRGPRAGAINVLSQVMQMVMVRHRIEDVEKDIILPPMRHDTIYMDLSDFALKSYNAMQAGIAINAIDSERRDQDYLFHPSRAKELQNAIDNLSQGMFWSASDILYNVDQICEETEEFMDRAIERHVSSEDIELLKQALSHAAVAAKDDLWRAMQHHEDVPFRVTGLDPGIFGAWTRAGLSTSQEIDLMHPNRLIDLRSTIRRRPLITKDKLVDEGNSLNKEESERLEKKPPQTHEITHADQVKKMVKEVEGEIEVLKKKAECAQSSDVPQEHPGGLAVSNAALHHLPSSELLASSPWSGVRIGPSLSTKLNYVLSEVLRYSPDEKFLIFSSSPLTLAHVAEGLSLFEIKYLRYTSGVPHALREQCVMTFESSDTFRVFLMELKLGARGLNLVSASRVIFCEPVWHSDVESQAVKRAHRIGQRRPISVKTLVIRSTAEEAMIARRQHLKSSDKIPKMTTESGMRQFIEHPRFLNSTSSEVPYLSLPLIYTPIRDAEDTNVVTKGSAMEADIDLDFTDCIEDEEDQARKKVKFS
ncbi:hypothetical protein HYDPIDRAFT_179066 [Hydnomerulius pinastri MD-312]|nr:hypothetical protein HYDPIDRAFT_179066 [Hydnomerulius pinastri MD-312]